MEASERLIRSTIFAGMLTVHRALDYETRGVGDMSLADYLILSRATLTPAGAPMRHMSGEFDLPVDVVAAKCSQFERSGLAVRTRDRSDRRAFSLSPTDRGIERYDLIAGSLHLRLRALWSTLPESTFEGIIHTLANLAAVPDSLASAAEEHRFYRTVCAVHLFASSCFHAAMSLDLTVAEVAILLLLDDANDQQADFAEIPSNLGVSQTIALPTLELLEKHDLVAHEDASPESRSLLLILTSRGMPLCAELKARLAEALLERGIHLDEESAAALTSICSLLRRGTRHFS
ncbi:MAG: hypothetical protein HGA39_08455 [Coriobacteriia bacterium]|nr:hypothetical protein [Coriobacteriia bacterium]